MNRARCTRRLASLPGCSPQSRSSSSGGRSEHRPLARSSSWRSTCSHPAARSSPGREPNRTHPAVEWFVAIAIGVATLIVVGEGQVLVRVWEPRGSTVAVAGMVLMLTFLPRRHLVGSEPRQEARTP